MSITTITVLIISTVFLLYLGALFVEYWKSKTLDEIREDVYQLFLKAEHEFTETKSGKQKMKWVVNKARSMLPTWLQFIITEENFNKIIQLWFDGIKALLDDGKINN